MVLVVFLISSVPGNDHLRIFACPAVGFSILDISCFFLFLVVLTATSIGEALRASRKTVFSSTKASKEALSI